MLPMLLRLRATAQMHGTVPCPFLEGWIRSTVAVVVSFDIAGDAEVVVILILVASFSMTKEIVRFVVDGGGCRRRR